MLRRHQNRGGWKRPGMSLAAVSECWPGGARRIGGASPVCGPGAERRRARSVSAARCPETGAGARGEPASAGSARGETVAGRAVGPGRSSADPPAWRGGAGSEGPGLLAARPFRQPGCWEERCGRAEAREESRGEGKKSPVTRECHAGICGSPGVKFPWATRQIVHLHVLMSRHASLRGIAGFSWPGRWPRAGRLARGSGGGAHRAPR